MSRTSKVFSLSVAQGVLMIVNVISGMIFSRELSPRDYGTYLQTFLAYDFTVPLLTLGLPSAMYYFLASDSTRKKGIVLENLILLFIAGAIFSLFLYFGGTEILARRFNNPELTRTLRWMVFYPLYTFPLLATSAVWVSLNKVTLNAVYNLTTGLIITVLLIIAVVYTKSFEFPILVRIYAPLFFVPFAIYYMFKFVDGSWSMPKFFSMWQIAKFAIPLGLASLMGTLTVQLSNIIVSMFSTPHEFAIYANGAKEIPLIGIITGSISLIIMSEMAVKIKEKDFKAAIRLFQKAAISSATFLFPTMIFLFIFSKSFIVVLFTEKYIESVYPFRIFLLLIPIRIAYYGAAFIALGQTRLVLYRSIVDFGLTAIFSYLFVKWLGAYGAAYGLVITTYLWTVPYNLYSLSKYFDCKMSQILPLKKLFNILIVSCIAGLVSFFCTKLELKSFMEISVGGLLYFLLYFSISWKTSVEFRQFSMYNLQKIINYKKK